MSNTWSLYTTIRDFQQEQRRAFDRYREHMAALEPYKGSEHYRQESEKAMQERRATEDAARQNARYYAQRTLGMMQEASRNRKAVAPTQEQINLLSVMKLRESVPLDELEAIARAMNGNSLGVSVIQEYARDQAQKQAEKTGRRGDASFIPDFTKYATDKVPDADAFLKNLASACATIIDGDGASRVRGMMADLHESAHGVPANRDNLPRQPIYEGEAQFFQDVSSVPLETVQRTFNSEEGSL